MRSNGQISFPHLPARSSRQRPPFSVSFFSKGTKKCQVGRCISLFPHPDASSPLFHPRAALCLLRTNISCLSEVSSRINLKGLQRIFCSCRVLANLPVVFCRIKSFPLISHPSAFFPLPFLHVQGLFPSCNHAWDPTVTQEAGFCDHSNCKYTEDFSPNFILLFYIICLFNEAASHISTAGDVFSLQ